MNSTVESLSSVKKKITFEIPADRVSAEIEKVFAQIRTRATVKGFRKGKVPQSLVEKHYGEAMEGDVLKNLFDETYFKALADHKIFPVSHPVIESNDIKKGEPLKYSATVEVLPEIEIKDYTGLKVKKEKFVLDNSVIANRLDEMREGMGQLIPAEDGYSAANGDYVVIDFKGFVEDEPFEGGSAENYQLELGSGRFIPGFEEQLVGMKVADEKPITVTFPEEYGSKELAGKEAVFQIKVNEIRVKELPEIDDEFAKQFGDFETLDQLKAMLSEMHEKQEGARIKSEVQERIIKALVEKNDIEVPAALVERQLQLMLSNMKNRLAQQRLSFEMMGMDDEKFKTQYRDVAESQVKGSLLLDAVANKEGVKVEECDIDIKVKEIADQNGKDFESVKEFYRQNTNALENLGAHLKEEKALDFLLEKADVTEVSKEEL